MLTKQTLLIFGRHSCRVTQVFDAKFVTDGLELNYLFPIFFINFHYIDFHLKYFPTLHFCWVSSLIAIISSDSSNANSSWQFD